MITSFHVPVKNQMVFNNLYSYFNDSLINNITSNWQENFEGSKVFKILSNEVFVKFLQKKGRINF